MGVSRMKGNVKKELKEMSIQELMSKLRDLQIDKMRLETKCFGLGGSVRLYPKEKTNKPHGNIKRIIKDIARVKTYLNIKMKASPNV